MKNKLFSNGLLAGILMGNQTGWIIKNLQLPFRLELARRRMIDQDGGEKFLRSCPCF
jgi:hypothetical protein